MRSQHGSGPLALPSSRRGRLGKGGKRSWPEKISRREGEGDGAGSAEGNETKWMHLD